MSSPKAFTASKAIMPPENLSAIAYSKRRSLNNFLSDTKFPYTSGGMGGMAGGPGGMPEGGPSDGEMPGMPEDRPQGQGPGSAPGGRGPGEAGGYLDQNTYVFE